MNSLISEESEKMSVLVATMLALIFLIPSIRAYIPMIPQASYILPIFILVALAILNVWRHPRIQLPLPVVFYSVLLSIMCLMLMQSSFWTITTTQYSTDLILLSLILILVLSCSVLIKARTVEILLMILCVSAFMVGLLIAGEFLILGSFQTEGSRISEIYLTIAHLLGLAAAGASVRYLVPQGRSWVWGIIAVLLFLELAISLARGALLSVLLIFMLSSVIIMLHQLWQSSCFKSWLSGSSKFLATFILGLATVIMALQIERTKTRLLRFFSGKELEEGGRGTIWNKALLNIQDSPWTGFGLSGNGPLSRGLETDYPHNLFLQVWLDGGGLALLLLIIVLAIPVLYFFRALAQRNSGKEHFLFPLMAMFSFLVLEYSKSANFYAARDLFIIGLCIVILSVTKKRGHDSHE